MGAPDRDIHGLSPCAKAALVVPNRTTSPKPQTTRFMIPSPLHQSALSRPERVHVLCLDVDVRPPDKIFALAPHERATIRPAIDALRPKSRQQELRDRSGWNG